MKNLILITTIIISATVPLFSTENSDSQWYDTFDYIDEKECQEFWTNEPGREGPTIVRDPKQGDGHMLRVSPGGSLVSVRSAPATDWWVKIHGPVEELWNYQQFGIRSADRSKHVLFYFDQPEPERVRIDVKGGEMRVDYSDITTGSAEPSSHVKGMAGLWHFHISKEKGVRISLNGDLIFERGPEYAFEESDMKFIFGSHYGGAVVDFEFISTTEP